MSRHALWPPVATTAGPAARRARRYGAAPAWRTPPAAAPPIATPTHSIARVHKPVGGAAAAVRLMAASRRLGRREEGVYLSS